MSNDRHEFTTQDVDLVAFFTLSGISPTEGFRDMASGKATFSFDRTPKMLNLLADYNSGQAVAPVNTVLKARRKVYVRVREIEGVRS